MLLIKIQNKNISVKKENGHYVFNGWITVKRNHDNEEETGRHLFVKDGETPKQAMKRAWGVDLDKKKQETEKTPKPEKQVKPNLSKKQESKEKIRQDFIDDIKYYTNEDLSKYEVKDDGSKNYGLEAFKSHSKRYKNSFLLDPKNGRYNFDKIFRDIKKIHPYEVRDFGYGYDIITFENLQPKHKKQAEVK